MRESSELNRREMRRREHVAQLADYESGPGAPLRALASGLDRAVGADVVVLVEGISDQIAIETLAARMGRDLGAEGAAVLPIGGAQAVRQHVDRLGADHRVDIVGLCDWAEREHYAKAFASIGQPGEGSKFFVCNADLEDELIRAMDPEAIEVVLESEGEIGAFRTMQKQPAWRGRPFNEQMHRWIRAHARRSSRYAKLLVLAIDDDRMPRPFVQLLEAC